MAGYYNYSMSNNAVAAYDDDEMPISKWSKTAILNRIEDDFDTDTALLADLLTHSELKQFLRNSSWHHCSKFFNVVDFYSFDTEFFEDFSIEKVADFLDITVEKANEKLNKLIAKHEVAYERRMLLEEEERQRCERYKKIQLEKEEAKKLLVEKCNKIIESNLEEFAKCEQLIEITYSEREKLEDIVYNEYLFDGHQSAKKGIYICLFRFTKNFVYVPETKKVVKYNFKENRIVEL